MMRHSPTLRAVVPLAAFLLLPGIALLSTGPQSPGNWVRQEPALEPTWPDQPRYARDAAYQPVLTDKLLLLASSRHDCLTAIDRQSGRTRWRFLAQGPLRTRPTVWEDLVYFTSDDGHLYCVHLTTGTLKWKVAGGPTGRHILGNERLISTWPARGGAMVVPEKEGKATVYFAAGIWPFMGIFLRAVDAQTGESRWTNSGDGSMYIKQPHQTDAFAGIAPQGNLVASGDSLLVPGGRSIPACYDRHTGQLIHYRLADVSKLGGGPEISAGQGIYINGGGGFELAKGTFLGPVREPAVIAEDRLYSVTGNVLRVFDLKQRPTLSSKETKSKRGRVASEEEWLGKPVDTVQVPVGTKALVVVGNKVHGGGTGFVYTLARRGGPLQIQHQDSIEGTAVHLAADGEQLIVSTQEGRIYSYTGDRGRTRIVAEIRGRLSEPSRDVLNFTKKVLSTNAIREGYVVVWGIQSGELVTSLLREPGLRIVVVEANQQLAQRFRMKMLNAGIDAKRVTVVEGTPKTAGLPPYFASLTICEDPTSSGIDLASSDLDRLFESLRPYGGAACFLATEEQKKQIRRWIQSNPVAGQARIEDQGDLIWLRRNGGLPGAGEWTHEHGNESNTRVSRDDHVKAPLGLLWFGGPGNQSILPRHGHGPVPQVCEGRLLIEGPNALRAIDIYTGRLLWQREFPGLGKAYDNLAHQPGANAVGSNYVTRREGIYVAYQNACLKLDPTTGKTVETYTLPPLPGETTAPRWTFLMVTDDHVIGGCVGVGAAVNQSSKLLKLIAGSPAGSHVISRAGSKRLTILDRKSGRIVKQIMAIDGFRHNAVCIGAGRLYAIDQEVAKSSRRKSDKPLRGRLIAVTLATGKQEWVVEKGIFGTWLSYSKEHDVLIEAGLMSRDTLGDEPAGMRAYLGKTGKVLWHRKEYFGPALILGDRILKGGDARAGSGTACDLRTGKSFSTTDPLTGQSTEWKWVRTYGCNTPAASEHLVVFRSGAAGFYDLCNNGGTGNFGGFRSSCTLNLIPAGGVLTVPDYTRTCTCSYQNQCSVGLIHMPEAEMWTFTTAKKITGTIRKVGINFGAPGSRKAENGTLWLEYPPSGGPSPRLNIKTVPQRPKTYRLHTSQVQGDSHSWVAASGLRDVEEIRIEMKAKTAKKDRYTVRLYFLEPDHLSQGMRLITVGIQGRQKLTNLDLSKETSGVERTLVREFKGIEISDELRIRLTTPPGSKGTVISGVEIVAEDLK